MDRSTWRQGVLAALVVVVFSVASPGGADAQSTNYSTFLYGDRVQGMGGAATGVAAEASASFYNPGGLAFQRRAQASLSLSLNAISKVTIDDGFETEIGNSDLVYEFNGSVPLFVGIVKKLGSEERFGVGRHALSISILTLGGGDRKWQASIRGDEGDDLAQLTVSRSDKVTLYGLSYAYMVSESLGIGMTAYLGLRDFSHSENILLRFLGQSSEPGVYPDAEAVVRTTSVGITAEVLLLRIGALWRVSERTSLGVMFQPPGITLGSRASINEREWSLGFRDDGASTFIDTSAEDLPADAVTPWALRLGISYLFVDNFLGAFDVAIWGPAGSADDPIQQWTDPPVEDGQPRAPNSGFYVSQYFYRELVVNAYVGFEWTIADRFPLRWGFLTNFSAVPEIEGPSDTYDNSYYNEFGGSLAFAVRDDGYDVGLGVIALFGSGSAHRLNLSAIDNEDEPLYRRAGVETWTVYFTISGAVGAVKSLAEDLIMGDDEDEECECEEGDEECCGQEGTEESTEGAEEPAEGGAEGTEEPSETPTEEPSETPTEEPSETPEPTP